MNDLPPQLGPAFRELADRAPHDPQLADTVRRRARHQRTALMTPLAAVVAVLVVLGAVGVLRSGGSTRTGGSTLIPTGSSNPIAATGCRPPTTGVLPDWARAGFSPPFTATFATSRSGNVLAVPFVTLIAPPTPDGQTNNKVLWIPHTTPPPDSQRQVLITAKLDGTNRTVQVVLPDGFGPSTVDLPVPGCWHLELGSGTKPDELDLLYRGAPSQPSPTN